MVPVRLTSDYRHDLSKMLATTGAGLVYVCNPNNPTASVTPKDEVRAFLSKVSRETFVLVDEAYYHYAEGVDYESVMPLVRIEIAAAGIIVPGFKVRASGGFGMPGYHTFNIAFIYLIASK